MSNLTPTDRAQPESSVLGAHSLAEILSQPRCWVDCLKRLESEDTAREIDKRFGNSPEWIFIGCGSSYYIALAAAASWTAITGTRARALPASELLLFPDLTFNGTKHELEDGRAVIGRSKECDIQLPDPNVSRRHAEVRQEGAAYWVIDLDSTNGMEVNGRRQKRVKLRQGDRITLGSTELVFQRETE